MTRIFAPLVFVVFALPGCADDTQTTASESSAASTGNESSTSSETGTAAGETSAGEVTTEATTGGSETTEATTGESETTTEATTGESETTTEATTGESETETEDTSATTEGVEPFDIPFVTLDPFLAPPPALITPGWLLMTSEAEWTAQTGVPVPPDIDFANEWLLLGSEGARPFPGHGLAVTKLTWDAGTVLVDADALAPADDCETYTFTWPSAALVSIEPLDVEVDAFSESLTPVEYSCADGVGESSDCDLEMPCASGLLCSGLIRSTVLVGEPWGLCLPVDHVGVFEGPGAPIPADGATVQMELNVAGLTTVDTDVVIWVETDHPKPEELVFTLRNPSDNEVSVWEQQPGPLHPGGLGIVPSGFSGDESVNGTWILSATDMVQNDQQGGVVSWQLEIMSRFD